MCKLIVYTVNWNIIILFSVYYIEYRLSKPYVVLHTYKSSETNAPNSEFNSFVFIRLFSFLFRFEFGCVYHHPLIFVIFKRKKKQTNNNSRLHFSSVSIHTPNQSYAIGVRYRFLVERNILEHFLVPNIK